MKSLLTASVLLALALTASAQAFEAPQRPLVVCGADDPAGSTEIDNFTVYRGGTYGNQLVLRNHNIIQYFLSRGAIYGNEINAKGEFIVGNGLGSSETLQGQINNRRFYFYPERGGYTLTVTNDQIITTRTGANVIADFHFNDCQKR